MVMLAGTISAVGLATVLLSLTGYSPHWMDLLRCVRSSPAQITIYTIPSLTWSRCTQELLQGVECANLSVPLDWSDADSDERINLLMTRLPASGSSQEKIGSLVYNPGGPGVLASAGVADYARSNSSFLSTEWSYLSADLRRRFDIIGPDPRGVGFSTPLLCDGTIWNPRVSRRPQTEEEFDALVKHNRDIGESCRKFSGRIIDFMDTASAARDIEAIRVALGKEPLNYLGFSYGTQLGMAYAELYPENIRSMVLDGVLDHSQTETDMFMTESQAFEEELDRFFDWCNTTSECALQGQDAPRLFDELINSATKRPIPAPGCDKACRKDVTAYELIHGIGMEGSILRKTPPPGRSGGWPLLSEHLKAAMAGNATAFSEPIWYDGISDIEANSLWGELGSECQDWLHSSKSVADTKNKNELGKVTAPHTQGISQSYDLQLRCLGWPTALTNPPHLAKIHGTPHPVLIVNAYYDPSTSYDWAVIGQKQIDDSVLLSRDGDGHTSYGLAGHASKMIDEYLVSLKVPAPDTVVGS
ncbi:hypothetical protein MBLNU459_g5546t1 [Dothideomycetes sp. NU459]